MSDVTLPAQARRMVDAINGADYDAFVEAFTDDGYVDDWGRVLRGPDGIRSWAETDAIGKHARMTVLECHVEGDTVRTRFDWRSERFNGESEGIFELDGERLASFRIPAQH